MNKILYVTSFNSHLFKICGRTLIQTYLTMPQVDHPILITYEDIVLSQLQAVMNQYLHKDKVLYYDLEEDGWLEQWLDANRDIIPETMGGEGKECNCPLGDDKWRTVDHIKGCPRTYYNFRASQWFRKVAALAYALSLNYDIIIFVDADIEWLKPIPDSKILEAFGDDYGVFYHLGDTRRERDLGIESGFIGFKKDTGGFDFLRKVIATFDTGEFRKYERWDDGYIFKKIVEECPQYKTRDLVVGQTKPKKCMEYGIFNEYVRHNKGVHKFNILRKWT